MLRDAAGRMSSGKIEQIIPEELGRIREELLILRCDHVSWMSRSGDVLVSRSVCNWCKRSHPL